MRTLEGYKTKQRAEIEERWTSFACLLRKGEPL